MPTPERPDIPGALRTLGVTSADLQQALQGGKEEADAYLGSILQAAANDPEKLKAWDIFFTEMNRIDPALCKQLVAALRVKSATLEMMGYEKWLKTLGPKTFTRPMTGPPEYVAFWEWNWRSLMKRRRGEPLLPKEKVGFVPWTREAGKSSSVEWSAIAEGAIIRTGYVIYLTGVQTLAEQHVASIRDRIEEEHLVEYYPHLAKPKLGAHGNRYGWGKDFLMTSKGWAIRPVGLDQAIRGGKTGDMRPTLIIVDDIDELDQSLAVIEVNVRKLTRSILAMGDANTRVLVAQNPIHSVSVVSRLLDGSIGALTRRTVFGPVSALRNFAFETRQEDGGPVHFITAGESNWPGISVEMWQDSLNRVGPEGFLAEYQHDFSGEQEERVLPEYDDRDLRINVIKWSQFIAKYFEGVDNPPKRIPNYWPLYLGGDIGYTPGHLSAFSWITRAPENAPLTGSIFRYRGRTYMGVAPDEIFISVRQEMWPARLPEYKGEYAQLIVQSLSHEKLGERLLANSKHGFYFMPCEKGKEAGIPQWRHFLRPDRSQSHPFHPDELLPDGKWKLGRPAWFDIVDDDQFYAPRDDAGLKTHRDQAYSWKYKKIKITESGQTVEQPMKIADDTNDSTRQLLTRLGPPVIPLTQSEKLAKAVPKGYDYASLQKRVQTGQILPEQAQMTYDSAIRRAERIIGKRSMALVDEFGQELLAD